MSVGPLNSYLLVVVVAPLTYKNKTKRISILVADSNFQSIPDNLTESNLIIWKVWLM